jgi:hypothetical protein
LGREQVRVDRGEEALDETSRVTERARNGKHVHRHECELASKEGLARFFQPYFRDVKVLEAI